MITKQQQKTASNYTKVRLAYDKESGQYLLMTDEGKFISGIVSLNLSEGVDSLPSVNLDIVLDK